MTTEKPRRELNMDDLNAEWMSDIRNEIVTLRAENEALRTENADLAARLERLREGPGWFGTQITTDISDARTKAFQDGWASVPAVEPGDRTRAGIAALDAHDQATLRSAIREVLAERDALRARLGAAEAGIAAEIARHGTGIRTGLEIAARIVRES